MKKILSLIAISLMLINLSGCLDPQDSSGEKLSVPFSGAKL